MQHFFSQYRYHLLFFCSLFIAGFLCLFRIGSKDFALDEVATVLIIKNWHGLLHFIWHDEGNMWLYYLLLYPWSVLGKSEGMLRLLSAVFSIATLPIVYRIGQQIFSKKAAALTTLLLSFHVFFIQNAQNARSYALLLFLTSLSILFLLRYLWASGIPVANKSAQNKSTKRFWYLTLYIFCSILSVYAHFYAIFVIAAAYTWLFLLSKKILWQELLCSLGIMLFSIIPLFLSPAIHNQPTNWIASPTLRNLIGTYILLSNDFLPSAFLYGLILLYASITFIKKRTPYPKWFASKQYLLLFIWILFPIVASFIFSLFIKPIYVSMYFFITVVPFTMLIAAILANIKRQAITAAVLSILLCFSIVRLYGWYAQDSRLALVMQNNNEDWRSAAEYLDKNVKAHDAVLFYPSFVQESVALYSSTVQPKAVTQLNLQPDPFTGGSPHQSFNTMALHTMPQDFHHIWYVRGDYTDATKIADQREIDRLLYTKYHQVKQQVFSGVTILYFEQ